MKLNLDLDDSLDEQAIAWFVRLQAENVRKEDWRAFGQWLEQTDEHRKVFNEICEIWGNTTLLKSLGLHAKEHKISPKHHKKHYAISKISLALATCLLCIAPFANQIQIFLKADYSSVIGESKIIQLDDGSTAMLNTNSAIAINIGEKRRLLELLKGEVFLNIKPDANKPFFVHAEHSTSRVLGTRFVVHNRNESDEIKVLAGRVEVSNNKAWKDPVVLGDNEAVTVYDNIIGQPKKLNSTLSTSWISGFLVYENETLETVITSINRYRSGVVFFKDDSLRKLRINGRLNIRESRDMLKVLQRTMNIKITFFTDWLVIVG